MSSYAVVELFTSEGCSSCPPADSVLAELAGRRAAGEPVFCLGFHVDYWDHLGWPDPFGDPAWTRRQRAYASAFGSRGLYTPQAVVNGHTELVGSNRRPLHKQVDKALRAPGLAISAAYHQHDGVVDVRATPGEHGLPDGVGLLASVVQATGRSEVARGENARRSLRHVDIVRGLGPLSADGRATLPAPDGVAAQDLSVVVIAQHTETMRILGATGSDRDSG